jgi:hypothetical protein
MNQKDNALEKLLGQVSEMISMIQNHKGTLSDHIPPVVLAEMERLEKSIALFEEINQKDLKIANIDVNHLKNEALQSTTIPKKDKNLIERAQLIENDARRLKQQVSKVLDKNKPPKKSQKNPNQVIKDRRNRFKPLGGNKNWIPL